MCLTVIFEYAYSNLILIYNLQVESAVEANSIIISSILDLL